MYLCYLLYPTSRSLVRAQPRWRCDRSCNSEAEGARGRNHPRSQHVHAHTVTNKNKNGREHASDHFSESALPWCQQAPRALRAEALSVGTVRVRTQRGTTG